MLCGTKNMNESKNEVIAFANIDRLMQEIWLQAIRLRSGPQFKEGEGRILWERCAADIARVQARLKSAALDDVSCQHILYAQCALLDEVIKGRSVRDDAWRQWYALPLQQHFLGTRDAGNKLCERMRNVLRDPAAHSAVLSCFHRVLLLGFLGEYRRLDEPGRRKLVKKLGERVMSLTHRQTQPNLTSGHTRERLEASWPTCLGLSVLLMLLCVLWPGLDYWFEQMLFTLLPVGVMR